MKIRFFSFSSEIRSLLGFAIGAVCSSVASAADTAADNVQKSPAKTATSDASGPAKMPEVKGLKHAIGVIDFENEAGKRARKTLGKDFREMLESALFATNRFEIVDRDRENLAAVAKEQKMQKKKKTAKASTVAPSGLIRSARYLATGAVTEVSQDTSGGNGSLNIAGVKVGGSSAKSAVVVIVKLIDTTTSEVVASERIRGEAGKKSVRVGYSGGGLSGDLGTFAKTPLGEAVQDCIDQAVKFIAAKMETRAIEGFVVTSDGEDIIVGLGENCGIAPGHRFTVRKLGKLLTDPGTGAVLDRREGALVGKLEVTRVLPKISYCKVVDGAAPQRGETVTLDKPAP
jgi:curli biogenesis system outer membrane secretion channel CsgG